MEFAQFEQVKKICSGGGGGGGGGGSVIHFVGTQNIPKK